MWSVIIGEEAMQISNKVKVYHIRPTLVFNNKLALEYLKVLYIFLLENR